jgi:hypothetical protein
METPANPSAAAGDAHSAVSQELKQVLTHFGVRGEPLHIQGEPSSQVMRVLVRTAEGDHGQLRVYPAAPESARRVADSLSAHLHLRQACASALLEPCRGSEGEILTRGDALYAYLAMPAGLRPVPPEWDLVLMTQLGKCAGSLLAAARNHRSWPRVESSSEWLQRWQGCVARTRRLAEPDSALLAVLPPSVRARVVSVADTYLRIAEDDAKLAPALAEAHESALWDAAGARSFVIGAPSPHDLFVDSRRAVVLAWPEQISAGVVWDGLLGEIARGRVTEDLDGALAALEAVHRMRPLSAEERALLPLVASPVWAYLDLIEGVIADAPVEREDIVLKLLDRWVVRPERAASWRRALLERLAGWDRS